jgi:hypothetical protein
VRYDGRALAGARVRVNGNGNVSAETDARGRFETPEFSCLEPVHVRIEGDIATGGGKAHERQLFSERFELTADEVRDIQLDLYPIPLRARVVAETTGEPIAGARVTARIQKENAGWSSEEPYETGSDGEVELMVLEPGEYAVSAEGDGFTRSQTNAKVASDGLHEPVVLRLNRSVPCAGRVQIDPAFANGPQGFSYLWVSSENGNDSWGSLEQPDHTFTLENLAPGKYTAHLSVAGRQGEEIPFELGPEGDENLLFVFTPRAEPEEDD